MTDAEMVLSAALTAHSELSEALAGNVLVGGDRVACEHIALAFHIFAATLSGLIDENMPR